jgi:hypothetical protein
VGCAHVCQEGGGAVWEDFLKEMEFELVSKWESGVHKYRGRRGQPHAGSIMGKGSYRVCAGVSVVLCCRRQPR